MPVNTILKSAVHRIWTREWTGQEIEKYIGHYQHCYFTYAADAALRERAASGGSVSALMLHLLETGQVDGALVCQTVVRDGRPRPEFRIVTTREGLIVAQGSKYTAVHFASDALPLIKAFGGRLAVVALPCDAKILAHRRAKDEALDSKIGFVFALFCGHNSEPELVDAIVRKLGDDHGVLTDYVYRAGHWRGYLAATFEDGVRVEKPFAYFSDYQNLYFYAQPKCHYCHDHTGYFCDISAGDIWSPRMRQHPIKHTALITRTEAGQRLVESALRAGIIIGQEEPIEEVADGQARTMPFHYNVTSRARVGRLFGYRITEQTEKRVRLVDYVLAALVMLNERFSRTRLGRWLLPRLPRPLIRLYLLLFKGLESL